MNNFRTTRHRALVAFASIAAALTLCAPVAHAVPSPQVSADATSPSGDSVPAETATSGAVTQEQVGSYQSGPTSLSIRSKATASFGQLHAYAESHYAGPSSIYSGAVASFRDSVTINADGMFGESGYFTFKLQIDGALSSTFRTSGIEAGPTSYARAFLKIEQNGNTLRNDYETQYANGNSDVSGFAFLNQEISVTAPIVFGTPFEMLVRLTVTANSRGEFGNDSTADLGNTLNWGGISSVMDGTSMEVGGFSSSSNSGTNYTQAVPEPGSAILLSGIGVAALLRRRRASAV